MAEDVARLVVSLEARVQSFEKALNKATGVADKKTRQIENRFKKSNDSIARGMSSVGASALIASKSSERLVRGMSQGAKASTAIGKSASVADSKMQRFLRGATTSATLLHGPLSGVGSRISAISGSFSRGNIAMAGFALTIGGVVFEMKKALDAFEKFEVSQRTIEAALKATGGASGRTAGQIEELAQSIALNTLASTEGVRNAAAKLLTFRSISGDAFDETLRLAQDLAATGFGTLETSIVQLGKAMEDPITGLTALKRSGVSFSESQKQVIQGLVDTGKAAEAQRIILEGVAKQVGGIGAAQAKGTVAGAYDTLSQSTENLLVNWGKQIAKAIDLEAKINAVARAMRGLDLATGGGSIKDRLAAVNEQIAALENLSAEAKLARGAVAAVGGAIGRAVGSAFGGPIGSIFGGILGDSATSVEEKLVELERLRTVLRRRAFAERLKELNAAEAGIQAQKKIVDDERKGKISAVTEELDKQLKLAGKLGVEREKALARTKAQVTAESEAGQKIIATIDAINRANIAAQQRLDLTSRRDAALTDRGTLGMSAEDAAIAIETQKKINEYKAAGIPLSNAQAAAIGAEVAETVRLEEANKRLFAAYDEVASQSKELLSQFAKDMKDGTSATEALGNALDNIADKLIDMATNNLVELALGGLTGNGGNPSGGGLGSAIAKIFGFAKGGIAANGRPVDLPRFASGGVSRSAAIFGEAGPEAAVPLPDGRRIPVDLRMPSVPSVTSAPQAINLTVAPVFNVQNGSAEGVDKMQADVVPKIRQVVRAEVDQLFTRSRRYNRSGV